MAPHLPHDFLAKLILEPFMSDKKSRVFRPSGNILRCSIADQSRRPTAGKLIANGFHGGLFRCMDLRKLMRQRPALQGVAMGGAASELYERYSFLHAAIDETDVFLACELIRLGAHIDQENGKGQSPLLQTLGRMWELQISTFKTPASPSEPQHTCIPTGKQLENAQKRLRYLAVVLIEQHANVNATLEWQGTVVSSVHIACILEEWELVALLLKHGAQSKPGPVCTDVKTFLHNAAARRRFNDLKKAENGSARPPQMCPCFSGRLLSECHSQSLPYPDHFVCACVSRKEYGKCCKVGGVRTLTEIWEEETKSIQVWQSLRFPTVTFSSPETHDVVMEHFKGEGGMDIMLLRFIGDPTSRILWTEALDIACREKLADAAFVFAYLKTGFFPILPAKDKDGKERCHEKQKWNAAVDAYIDSGIDTRPHSEIKRAAKIGASMGAMYPACQAEYCGRVEGGDVEKLLACAGCQRAFYCGARCQRLHWPTHKKVCGRNRPQLLPSQELLCDFVVKYSAMKWWLINHGHGESDRSVIARLVLGNDVTTSSTASPTAASSSPETKDPVKKSGQRISDLKDDLDAIARDPTKGMLEKPVVDQCVLTDLFLRMPDPALQPSSTAAPSSSETKDPVEQFWHRIDSLKGNTGCPSSLPM
ncbi:hypothetical protein DFH06DRAFT_1158696 [Mycena polygramma]|nr:hypothetical protein DFH06DRAFT_1158696 [Mycena polygramma]